ncbi:MAG: hypothetical protein KDB63_11215 [Nocardioidaceae bacterium]|nr:hypothetical protein [Nocardioidaceae bacterium]
MRHALALLGLLVLLLGVAPAAAVAVAAEDRPSACDVARDGQLPTCVQKLDGTWTVEYTSSPTDGGAGWAAIFLIIAIVVTAFFVWRVSIGHKRVRRLDF